MTPLFIVMHQHEVPILVYISIFFCLTFTLFWLQIVTEERRRKEELACCLVGSHRLNSFFPSVISLI